ncbi:MULTISPECIES: sulfite exporter TauE/SafE family protein [Phyllobacteriaceae]|uniref:sulfite exporter TauE/SafE family protein n=1 Tax=Phyllobacteriaceae TaxID=69277 RepID=UPI002ACA5FD9|nr:sulfite exporter TauE/SafE family protein [Chelativorans sp. M5D2P16]MDZ5696606.1 sulfite exporter TauE/SafE family protein [Chelativorans sp. M5D2P16]
MPDLALFILAGLIGGAVNALAGGAKLFIFPLLIASGLPPVVANATSTVALWPAQLPAAWLYRHIFAGRAVAFLRRLAPALAGALMGSFALILSPEDAFLAVVPFLLVLAVVAIALGNRLALLVNRLVVGRSHGLLTMLLMFLTGFYGGYFAAGLGFFLITILTMGGMTSIRNANAEKNLSAFFINTTTIIPYFLSGLVDLQAALSVLAGGLVGGYCGGWLSKYLPETPMRILVATLGLILTLSFLF